MNTARVMLADGSPVVIDSVTRMLKPEFEVVGAYSDGPSMLAEAKKLNPKVMIIDILMPGLSGFEAIRRLKKMHVPCAVIFLTVHQDLALADEARAMGAMGYVLKPSADRELLTAIHEALEGRFFLSSAFKC